MERLVKKRQISQILLPRMKPQYLVDDELLYTVNWNLTNNRGLINQAIGMAIGLVHHAESNAPQSVIQVIEKTHTEMIWRTIMLKPKLYTRIYSVHIENTFVCKIVLSVNSTCAVKCGCKNNWQNTSRSNSSSVCKAWVLWIWIWCCKRTSFITLQTMGWLTCIL